MADDTDNNGAGGKPNPDAQTLAERLDARETGNTQDRIDASREAAEKEREALTTPADIGAAGSAKGNMDASGAIMEPSVKTAVDVDHPAVDNNPRAGTTERQNQIDFNDPTLSDRKAVEQRLDNQS